MGQFVAWPHADLLDDTNLTTAHAKVRRTARTAYMETARRQQDRHVKQTQRLHKEYAVGQTVGVRISSVDRTNTDGKLIPCKVLKKDDRSRTPYQVYSAAGIIRTHFSALDLADMRTVFFPALEQADPATLEEVTLIRASRENSKWQNPTAGSTCHCKGTCATLRCQCRKAGLQCATKCHPCSKNCSNR